MSVLMKPMDDSNSTDSKSKVPDRFATTRWTMVAEAGHTSSPNVKLALTELCEAYWYPLYAFAKRKSATVEEAQDLTQAFFVELLDKNVVGAADPERGKFRSFLLTSFKHFMSKQWEKGRALKRGGGERLLSLDFKTADSNVVLEPAAGLTAEQIFDQQWAITLLDRTFSRLENEHQEPEQQLRFQNLKSYVIGDHAGVKYADVASRLNISEDAAKKAASRMRARFRDLLREEISQTVATQDTADSLQVDEEIRSLFAVFRRK